jgi:hypothetical protein
MENVIIHVVLMKIKNIMIEPILKNYKKIS